MKFIGKIEKVTAVKTDVSSNGNPWSSCEIVAWHVNESGYTEKVLLYCLNAACEKAQVLAGKWQNADGSYGGEFEFYFTPVVRTYTDKNGVDRMSQEMLFNHVVERV